MLGIRQIYRKGEALMTTAWMAFLVSSFGMLLLGVTKLVIGCPQSCRTVEPIDGFCLEGQSYKSYTSVTLERCIHLCEQHTGCFSINYYKRAKICGLNSSSKDNAIEHLVQDNSCLYIDNVLHQQFTPIETEFDCKSDSGPKPLGMRSGEIEDTQITGSNSHPNHEPFRGRLGSSIAAWMTLTSSSKMFIQVSFGDAKRILTDVASQGSPVFQCWVTQYTIRYKMEWNQLDWETYTDGSTNRPHIFEGNTDMSSVVKNTISRPVLITAVRVSPHKWHACIAMRIELYGCEKGS